MNIKCKIIGLILIFGFSFNVQGQKYSEHLENVISVFLANYYVPVPVTSNISFHKKGDMLYVVKRENFFKALGEEVFYNFAKDNYEPVTIFNKRNIDTKELQLVNFNLEQIQAITRDVSQLKKSSSIFKDADIFPYYGYDGFYNDVIDLYKDRDDLFLNEQFSLCKAYSYRVVNLLYDNYPNGLESEKINLDKNGFIDSTQISYYLNEFEKERNSYKNLKEKFPEFLTPTGSAIEKYGHIVIHSYIKLLYCGNEEIASRVLEDHLFPESVITYAKKILNSCPINSVLYTWGDQDTYPLYYLQGHEQYRTDVIIINISLSVLPRYVKMVYQGPFGSLSIPSMMPEKLLNGISVIYHASHDVENGIYDIEKYYNYISNHDLVDSNYGSNYMGIPVSTLLIPLPEQCEKTFIELELPNYIFLSDLTQLDILTSNKWERTICFTKECLKSNNLILKPFTLEEENLIIIDFKGNCN